MWAGVSGGGRPRPRRPTVRSPRGHEGPASRQTIPPSGRRHRRRRRKPASASRTARVLDRAALENVARTPRYRPTGPSRRRRPGRRSARRDSAEGTDGRHGANVPRRARPADHDQVRAGGTILHERGAALRELDMGVVLAQALRDPTRDLCRGSVLRTEDDGHPWHVAVLPFIRQRRRKPTRLVRRVEGGLDLRRDASPLADRVTLAAGPLANRCGRTAATRAGASASARPAADAASVTDPRSERRAQLRSVCVGQIDLVGDAVQGERDGLGSGSAIKIVDKNNLHLLCHVFLSLSTRFVRPGRDPSIIARGFWHADHIRATNTRRRRGRSRRNDAQESSAWSAPAASSSLARANRSRRSAWTRERITMKNRNPTPTEGRRPARIWTARLTSTILRRPQCTGFTSGNRIVSRIPRPVRAMSSRSIPIPIPPLGGIAYSIAVRKSSSTRIASSSPAAASSAWASKRSRWITGSTSSEYAVASSKPRMYRSHFSTNPGMVRWSRVSGEVSTGKSRTKVGASRWCPTNVSQSLSLIHISEPTRLGM